MEICGSLSDIEISKCVFTWDTWNQSTFDNCAVNNVSFLSTNSEHMKNNQYCYLFATNDTYFYGNPDVNPKGPWVRNIDFYFKIKNITAVTSKYLSVATISGQLMDPGKQSRVLLLLLL